MCFFFCPRPRSSHTKENVSQICSTSQTIFIFCRNYPSWLFVETPANNTSSDHGDLDPDRDDGGEIVVVECTPARHVPDVHEDDDSDSEDEGWYSLSRTDVRKLQEVRSSGERCDVNIILTNPDILNLCDDDDDEDEDEDGDEDERKQQSSPERTSYR